MAVLLPPQYVKPYVERARTTPPMQAPSAKPCVDRACGLVLMKAADQQAAFMAVGVREQLIPAAPNWVTRSAVMLPSLASQLPRGRNKIEVLLARIAADRNAPEPAKRQFAILAEEYTELRPKLRGIEPQPLD